MVVVMVVAAVEDETICLRGFDGGGHEGSLNPNRFLLVHFKVLLNCLQYRFTYCGGDFGIRLYDDVDG